VVDQVSTPTTAWLLVEQGTCASPTGSANAAVLLESGTHDALQIELEAMLPRPATGETPNRFCISLFDDVATTGELTSEDQPLTDADGPVQVEITGAVSPATPDLRLVFGAVGTSD